ncbi:hypothetical protein [Granulicella arctica]|uniref:hypothetical protein n=1 Tax=Granulicella arctica TaxID=940613 RepID=UPI0021E0F8D8|nr:hypothetical protein [Granulicella arctica]
MDYLDTILRRYTHLPALLHMVQHSCLTFLSPETWDDRQDAFFIQQYQSVQEIRTVLAVCLSEAPETYHHWYTFAHGPSGVSIAFKRERLLTALNANPDIRHGRVEYVKINDLGKHVHGASQMPFLKRFPFSPECEYRLLYERQLEEVTVFEQKISLDCIDRIYLSPWMPNSVATSVKTFLKASSLFKDLR